MENTDTTIPSADIETPIEKPTGKVYTQKQLYLASFLGGPLAIGYLFSKNFKLFNEEKKAMYSWVITIAFSVLLLAIIFSLPDSSNTSSFGKFIPIAYTLIAVGIFTSQQEKNVNQHLDAGGEPQSWGRVVVVGIIGLILMSAVIFGYAFLEDGSLQTKTYGTLKHEIQYDEGSISIAEIDQMGYSLEKNDFFSDEAQRSVYVTKSEKKIAINFSLIENSWEDPEVIEYFTWLRNEVQKDFPRHQIVIELWDGNTAIKKSIEGSLIFHPNKPQP